MLLYSNTQTVTKLEKDARKIVESLLDAFFYFVFSQRLLLLKRMRQVNSWE